MTANESKCSENWLCLLFSTDSIFQLRLIELVFRFLICCDISSYIEWLIWVYILQLRQINPSKIVFMHQDMGEFSAGTNKTLDGYLERPQIHQGAF